MENEPHNNEPVKQTIEPAKQTFEPAKQTFEPKVQRYEPVVQTMIDDFWRVENLQEFTAEDRERIKAAFELAYEAHKPQRRKGGDPYITHPISVARIVAEEFQLDPNTIIAAFLHDVVEDTDHTVEQINEQFGADVAFLVKTVTKEKKAQYEMSKQLDNYKQMLNSIQYDIRALLVKLADRLHNMRTLSSMRPDKQMKIAGETDYFYAPLANRLGLYEVKTELENLSMQYRCPQEYAQIQEEMEQYKIENDKRLTEWCLQLKEHFTKYQINVDVYINFYSVYALWKQIQKTGSDLRHIPHKYNVQIIFYNRSQIKEKDRCLNIYSALTDLCKELPGSLRNYVDSPKENGYEALHVNILAPNGSWQKVQIASERMFSNSKVGCVAERVAGVNDWISKFKEVLKDMAFSNKEGGFMEGVVANFYNDDILVFTPKGMGVMLPKSATAIDFAYAIHSNIGNKAQYARINGAICSIKTTLHRGDCVEIGTSPNIHPKQEWLDYTTTYKAKRNISLSLRNQHQNEERVMPHKRCPLCSPLPGEEVIGFEFERGDIAIHKRNCPNAIRLASERGDNIINVDFNESSLLYSVTVNIKAVDRYHLLSDLVNVITEDLHLSIDNLTTTTIDEIVDCTINFSIHSAQELRRVIAHIKTIANVDEVKRIKGMAATQK
ncbi:MAG: HD domain-containing protein [Rikenellaceae bacterium]